MTALLTMPLAAGQQGLMTISTGLLLPQQFVTLTLSSAAVMSSPVSIMSTAAGGFSTTIVVMPPGPALLIGGEEAPPAAAATVSSAASRFNQSRQKQWRVPDAVTFNRCPRNAFQRRMANQGRGGRRYR